MEKTAIRVVGVLLILWGVLWLIYFLQTGNLPSTLINYHITWNGNDFNLTGFVLVVISLITGVNIIRLRSSGRIWGLVILWLSFLQVLVGLVVFTIYAIRTNINSSAGTGWISFNMTYLGLGQHIITSPLWFLALLVLIMFFIGAQIFVLSSKKNKLYFVE